MSNPQDIRNQERLLPGLAMVAAATIGSAALVRGSQSLPVRILTPLTATAVAVYYCLPDHVHWHDESTRVPLTSATATAAAANVAKSSNKHAPSTASVAAARPASVELKPRSTVVDKTIASAAIKQHDAVTNRVNTVTPKDKDESLQSAKGTSAYVSKNINRHADTVKKELSKSKDSAVKATKNVSVAAAKGANEAATKAKTTAKDNVAAVSKGAHETSAKVNATVKGASTAATKGANEDTAKVEKSTAKGPSTTAVSKGANEVAAKVEKADAKATDEATPKSSGRKIVVDKNLAKAAIKQHDAVINRGGSQAGERARKVHESVVDAGLPSNRQGRYEAHKIDISREASDHAGNKFVVMEIPTEERNSSRSERGL